MKLFFTFHQRKSRRTPTPITNETISRIAVASLFDNDTSKNERLYELHQILLTYAMQKNRHREVGLLWNLLNDSYILIKGSENGISLRENREASLLLNTPYDNSLVFLHNHPKNSIFSFMDLHSFCSYPSLAAITAICNDGRIHLLRKEINFNPDTVRIAYNEFLQKGQNGIKGVLQKGTLLGLYYKCSVPHKKL